MIEIHQFAPIVLYGDAVGNQIVAMRQWLDSRGIRSKVYAPSWDPRYAAFCDTPENYRGRPENVVILQHCVGTPVADLALQLKDRVVPYYHNITPAEYYQPYDPGLAQALVQGREQLRRHSSAPYALAVSEYNRLEMLKVGYARVDILPLFINPTRLSRDLDRAQAASVYAAYADGRENWLFVGRLSPNKRQDNVIRAFNYHHRLVNPHSRLLLIGTDAAPRYADACRALAARLGLGDSVVFAGHVPDAVLGAYFEVASLFVCLSEHEGFGAPVLEAMSFKVPVVALNATGVAMTMGDAGILVNQPRPDAISEIADVLAQDDELRQRVITKQTERLGAFSLDAAHAAMEHALRALLQPADLTRTRDATATS